MILLKVLSQTSDCAVVASLNCTRVAEEGKVRQLIPGLATRSKTSRMQL